MNKLFVLTLLSVVLIHCNSQEARKLVWSDEFSKAGQPDSSKWSYDLGDGCPDVCGWGNNELEYYTNDSKNVRVENDRLIIEAQKDSLGGKAFTSSRLVSKFKGDWLYGRIEVKAKLPRGKGTCCLDVIYRLEIWGMASQWRN